MPHPRVHVRLGAFDVIVEIITEQLDVRDGPWGIGGSEVSREEDKCDITSVFSVAEIGQMTDFQWRVSVRVQDLRSILDSRLSTSIHEFL